MTNEFNSVLYTGVTNNLKKRVFEHKEKNKTGFTSKYNVNKQVYYQHFTNINDAIAREKQIKGGSRKKKIQLIEELNKKWEDLFESIL